MKFFNREKEKYRLLKALKSRKPRLVIIYGRRRCGKTTLIKNTMSPDDIYFVAQQSDEAIQRMQMAKCIGEKINGFDAVVYPDWESLFVNLNNVIKKPLSIYIDEFPYLVKSCGELPGFLQKLIDHNRTRKYHLILCGSSQQMMHGLVLDSSSPLYGRADEILKIMPLEAGWIAEALNCTPETAVVEYSVWGGVPRYWEMRAEQRSFKSALINIVLDRFGPLHEEPARLFLDDMRELVQSFSILSVIGNGSNRLSEIAGRLSKPVTNLSRPVDNLIKLGYLKREIPFGELEKNSKKGIYRISDPFMNFYFSFLAPNLSRLDLGMTDMVYKLVEKRLPGYVSNEWESICRLSVPMGSVCGINFDVASRWCGRGLKKDFIELDVVAESTDRKHLLVGECKWLNTGNTDALLNQLEQKSRSLPFAAGRKIIPVLFVKETTVKNLPENVLLPPDVLDRLKF